MNRNDPVPLREEQEAADYLNMDIVLSTTTSDHLGLESAATE